MEGSNDLVKFINQEDGRLKTRIHKALMLGGLSYEFIVVSLVENGVSYTTHRLEKLEGWGSVCSQVIEQFNDTYMV